MRKTTIHCKQSATAVGFCHYSGHYGYITKEALKKHNCLGKECRFFQMYETSEYWINYFNSIKRKKIRKIYAKNRFDYAQCGITIDAFCRLCKEFYGTWNNVPFNKKTYSINVRDFILHLNTLYSLNVVC